MIQIIFAPLERRVRFALAPFCFRPGSWLTPVDSGFFENYAREAWANPAPWASITGQDFFTNHGGAHITHCACHAWPQNWAVVRRLKRAERVARACEHAESANDVSRLEDFRPCCLDGSYRTGFRRTSLMQTGLRSL